MKEEIALNFAEWLRINFENKPEESDNYWEDIFYKLDPVRKRNYTTSELWEVFKAENNIGSDKCTCIV